MYYFEVEYWDSDDNVLKKDSGLVAAKDYGQAAKRIVKYYGNEFCGFKKFYECEKIMTEYDLKELN